MQLPPDKGGWGENLIYYHERDSDEDYIPDDYELKNVDDNYKYTIDPDTREIDMLKREAWDHATYDEATGRGLCTLNEAEVATEKNTIRLHDWSVAGGEQ